MGSRENTNRATELFQLHYYISKIYENNVSWRGGQEKNLKSSQFLIQVLTKP